jgi:hypothetical protein
MQVQVAGPGILWAVAARGSGSCTVARGNLVPPPLSPLPTPSSITPLPLPCRTHTPFPSPAQIQTALGPDRTATRYKRWKCRTWGLWLGQGVLVAAAPHSRKNLGTLSHPPQHTLPNTSARPTNNRLKTCTTLAAISSACTPTHPGGRPHQPHWTSKTRTPGTLVKAPHLNELGRQLLGLHQHPVDLLQPGSRRCWLDSLWMGGWCGWVVGGLWLVGPVRMGTSHVTWAGGRRPRRAQVFVRV